MLKLDRAQNKALWMVKWRYNSTPVIEALHLQSGLLPVRHKARLKRLMTIAAVEAGIFP